ncbi:protein bonzai 3 [Quercus suber]|uniref:Protein bonzai 3 n=1 Tax=Quercus suber TaxID=58331 RepID=A0AAW0KGJ5_QUESU
MDQLSQSEARHEENFAQAPAQLEARHQENFAQVLAPSDVRHQEQLTQSNARHQEQMREMMLHMKEMLICRQPNLLYIENDVGAFQRKQDFNDVVEVNLLVSPYLFLGAAKEAPIVTPLMEYAIMEVGEVIQFYDSNRRFLAWGFGGRTIDGSTCFNLNGSTCAFEVSGADFVMLCFAYSLKNLTSLAYCLAVFTQLSLFLCNPLHLKSASVTIDVLHSSITSKSHTFSTKHEKF